MFWRCQTTTPDNATIIPIPHAIRHLRSLHLCFSYRKTYGQASSGNFIADGRSAFCSSLTKCTQRKCANVTQNSTNERALIICPLLIVVKDDWLES